jgi:alkylation response protein AidB-like acyl-CoA dehydrogenase
VTANDLADLHDELRAVARDLLAPLSPLRSGGDAVAVDWRTLAQAGWPGLEVPEDLGGAGATFAETAVVAEEVGRAATASPFLGTAVLGVGALRLVAPSPHRDALLAGIAAGDTTVAVALPDGADDGVVRPRFRIERGRLHGRAPFVPGATDADRVLVVATDAAHGPVLVDADVAVTPTPVVDATRSLAEVRADGAAVDPGRCWAVAGDAHELLARGALAVALDSLGLAEAALAATVAYAGVRHQFGRPIGSFQAVKHACADTAVALALSRQLVRAAVAGLVAGDPDAEVATSMAKAYVTDAAVAAVGSAVQLHGGIGYTWEHGLHALLKRATLNRSLLGSPRAHRARLAERYAAAAVRM